MTSSDLRQSFLSFWGRQSSTMRGIILMCVSTVCASTMHALVRVISHELPPVQVAFFRNLFGLVVLMPLLVRSRFAILRTGRVGLHVLRGFFNITSMFLFFTGLSMTPLARANALNFTAPIFVALMSVIFLGERFRLYRWLAIVMGFVGMLIILRPGFVTLDTGSLYIVASASLWAVAMILIKILSRTESSVTIVAWMGVSTSIMAFGPALWVWQPISAGQLLWMLMVGLFGTASQVTLSQSLKESDPTAVLPFDFLKLIWASVIGMLFFAEVPDAFTFVGAAVIFSSGLMIAYRDRRAGRTSAPPPRA